MKWIPVGLQVDNFIILEHVNPDETYKHKKKYLCKCTRCGEIDPVTGKTLINHTSGKCFKCNNMKYPKYLKKGDNFYGVEIASDAYRLPKGNYRKITPDLYEYECICQYCGEHYWALKTNIVQGRSTSCGCLSLKIRKEARKLNKYEILEDGRVEMEFSGRAGKYFYIDYVDLEKVKEYTWMELSNGYVYANTESKRCHLLHEFLLPLIKGFIVDHEDRNPVNCVRSNLRYATDSQNSVNKERVGTKDSKMTRVRMNTNRDAWTAKIDWEEIDYHLGTFDTEEGAVRVRIIAEITLFEDFMVPVPDEFLGIYDKVTEELKDSYDNYVKRYQRFILAMKKEREQRMGGQLRKKQNRFNYYLETGKLE